MNRFVFKQKSWGQVGGEMDQRENIGGKIKYSGEEMNKTQSKAGGGNAEEALGFENTSEL